MSDHFFWLTREQFARMRPHLPTDTRGVARVDDRRAINTGWQDPISLDNRDRTPNSQPGFM